MVDHLSPFFMIETKPLQKLRFIKKSSRLCAVVGLTLATALAYSQPIDQDKVNHIKAAYIFHMAQLTTWPSEDLGDLEPLQVLFIGDGTDKLADILADNTKTLLVQGRRLEVNQISELSSEFMQPDSLQSAISDAHIIYVSKNVAANALAACRRYANHSILFAGDGQVVPRNGGMVGFYVDDQRVRINVNLLQVEQATLKMSAEFLQHVTIVRSTEEGR